MIIVLGDFNACVGGTPAGCPAVGPHGLDDCNENGELLRDLCVSNNLLVTNTWFQHKPLHQCRWYRNGNHSHRGHMIDYVLVNHSIRSSVLDTRVYCYTYLQSDHELVVSSLRFKIKAKRHKSMCNTCPQPQSLSTDVVSSFKSVLLEAFDRVPQEMLDVEDTWNLLKGSLQEAC